MHGLFRSLTLVGLIAVATAAKAEAPLSDAEVRGFVASLASVETLAARHGQAGLGLVDALENPMSVAIQQMRGRKVLGDLEATIRRHGFADAAHWSAVGDRLYRAYFALTMEREAPGAQAEMQQALLEVERNPQIGEADKQAMREAMTAAMAGMRTLTPASEADKAVVAAHMELLEREWRSK